MKLNLDYSGDPRWEQMSETHKKSLPIPNLFISLLYQYQDDIPNISNINFAIETGTHDARTSIFLAEHFDSIIGKKSKLDLPSDKHINWSDIE